jgi:uncharacterized membrane protein
MTTTLEIDSYLASLRSHLGPFTIAGREEIVREIGAHIRDSAEESGAAVSTILARLGTAEELAAQYREGLLIRRASQSFSPVLLLRASIRLGTKGFFGFLVFFLGLFGYLTGANLVLTALVKPFLLQHTGLWLDGNGNFMSAGVQFPGPGSSVHEVLGFWYIPLGLTIGSLALVATTWAIRRSLRTSQHWQARF